MDVFGRDAHLAVDAFLWINMVAIRVNRDGSGSTKRLAFEALATGIVLLDLISCLSLEGFVVSNVHSPDLDCVIVAILTERLDRENRDVGANIKDNGFFEQFLA